MQLRLSRVVPIILSVFLALPALLAAQEPVTITGKVTSDAGQPLGQVEVAIPTMGLGALTKEDGGYAIVVPGARVSGQTVTVAARRLGYKSQSAQITLTPGGVTHDFTLAANPLQLGEVVVTGAGTASAVEKLGSVRNNVDPQLIQRSNEDNLVNALAAKAPNVLVVSSSGEPGSSSYIRIRGLTTFVGTGQPLFVVDGMPIDNSTNLTEIDPSRGNVSGTTAPNRASDVNADDIESVEILKGASAGAIYGSRAGQGVVLITTKHGRPGQTRYSLRSSASFDHVTNLPYLQRSYGVGQFGVSPSCVPGGTLNCRVGFDFASSFGPKVTGPTFDHASELFRHGYETDNTLTMSGGNDRTTFYLSGGYDYNRGIIVGPNNLYERTSVRFNGSHRVIDNLKIGANVAYVNARGNFVQHGSNISGLLLGEWRTPPDFNNLPYLDPVSGLQRSFRFPNPGPTSQGRSRGYDNPFFIAYQDPSTSEVGRVYGNVTADYTAFNWLKFNYTLGTDYSTDERMEGLAQTSSSSTGALGTVERGYFKNFQLDHNLAATATYTVSPNLSGTVTVGQDLNVRKFRTEFLQGNALIAPQPFTLTNTSSRATPVDSTVTIHGESYFGQATGDLYDQLYLTVAVRNDGSSTFGADNRRNWFPKASAAWTFSKPLANRVSWLSYGKLRAAYGATGTEPSPYLLQSTFQAVTFGDGGWGPSVSAGQNGQGGLALASRQGASQLKPERVKEFETGADFGLFRDRADASVTYYRAISSDVIFDFPVPGSTGFLVQAKNAGSIRNTGWEATLNLRPVNQRDFGWEVGFQWARNRGVVTKLAGVAYVSFTGSFNDPLGVAIEGQPASVLYGSDFIRCGNGVLINGVDIDATSCSGHPKGAMYLGSDGVPVKDLTFRVLGDPNPDWTGNVHTSFRFRKLQIAGLLDVRHGGVIWNGTRAALNHFGKTRETEALRGTQVTFGTDYLPGSVAGPGVGTKVTLDDAWWTGAGGVFNGPQSEFLESASFVKLREVSVGYTLDAPWVSQKLGFTSIELRVSGRNLKTWTNYTGIDPETSLVGGAGALRGIDYFNNPQTRSYVFTVVFNR